jgi:hypothetical protein
MSLIHEHRLSTVYQIKRKSDDIANRKDRDSSNYGRRQHIKTIKEGILSKKRDHIKGWRARYFFLDNKHLHYCLPENKSDSLNSMSIKGAIITDYQHDSSEYFAFTIVDAKGENEWVLSSKSKEDLSSWMDALRKVANPSHITNHSDDSDDTSNKEDNGISTQQDTNMINGSINFLESVPDYIVPKIEIILEKMVEHALSNISEWTHMFDKEDVKAYRKPGVGTGIIRGDIILKYTPNEIFDILTKQHLRTIMYPDIESFCMPYYYKMDTGIEYSKCKTTWPAKPRDFANIFHWRILHDQNTIIIFSFTDVLEKCPEIDSHVRGNLLFGGYVLRNSPHGTLTTIVSHVR